MTSPPPPDPNSTPRQSRLIAAVPFYYGWLVLAAGTLGLLMTIPGQTVGVSVFLDRIILDLDLSRSLVSLLYMVGTLSGSLALPFIGRFIDRQGPRVAVITISSLFALACVGMGFARSLVGLAIGFVAVRGLGQGALSLVSLNAINLWFVRRRGLALSLSGLGMAAGISLFPLFIEFLIDRFDWRVAYGILGAVVACTILPVGALVFRQQPERYGLQPDRYSPISEATAEVERNYTLAEARRTMTFWLFTAGNFCVAALITGLVFHHYSILAASGVDRTQAALVFLPFGFVSAAANFVAGLLLDRISPRFLLCAMLLFLVAALLMASQVVEEPWILAYGSVLGGIQGMSGVLQSGVYAYYFGRSHLGSISGLASTIAVAGTSFGPLLFAFGFERSGSYAPVFTLSTLLPLGIAIASLWLEWKSPANSKV